MLGKYCMLLCLAVKKTNSISARPNTWCISLQLNHSLGFSSKLLGSWKCRKYLPPVRTMSTELATFFRKKDIYSVLIGLEENRDNRRGYCQRTCYQGENFCISNRAAPTPLWTCSPCHFSPGTDIEEGHSWKDLGFHMCLKTGVQRTGFLW